MNILIAFHTLILFGVKLSRYQYATMNTKRILSLSILILSAIPLAGCGEVENKEDIVILYTTDVHCAIDSNVGYAHFAGYRDHMKEVHDHVFTLDAGDFLQGDLAGALSDGSYITDIMNVVGYDAVTLGNHEFDFGLATLEKRIEELNASVLSCNISYLGEEDNALEEVMPYKILDQGDAKIGVVGVTTPRTLTSVGPDTFKENGKVAYDFASASKEHFYSTIQSSIDDCKKEGADHVVLLVHLGEGESFGDFSSDQVARNTSGAIAVLDGHLHNSFVRDIKNKEDKNVLLCEAGKNLELFGKLVIKPDGTASASNIQNKDYKSEKVQKKIDEINKKINDVASIVIGTSDAALSGKRWDGTRLVRNRETTIGNFVADAYRHHCKADIAFANGGSIRADLPKGEITLGDIIRILPFGDRMCTIKATGKQILDHLEVAAKNVTRFAGIFGIASGEYGGFAQTSGIDYTIDTGTESPVKTDSQGKLIGIDEGPRRIHYPYVLTKEGMENLDESKTYTVCSTDFTLIHGGDGNTAFEGAEIVEVEDTCDYEAAVEYFQYLGGHLADKYAVTEERIVIA